MKRTLSRLPFMRKCITLGDSECRGCTARGLSKPIFRRVLRSPQKTRRDRDHRKPDMSEVPGLVLEVSPSLQNDIWALGAQNEVKRVNCRESARNKNLIGRIFASWSSKLSVGELRTRIAQ